MPLTKDQINDVFWEATVRILGLDPDSGEAAVHRRVRKSWPKNDIGNSDWGREENVVFLRITPTGDEYTKVWDISHEETEGGTLQEVVRYHRCYSIQWVCYGPDAGEDADAIRIGILTEELRAFLRKYGLAVLTGTPEPIRSPEPDESGDWWERSDLTALCYELAERRYSEGNIEQAPHVTIQTQEE